MNISKNLLSLGLIAVISGISTAQTYTATAGTNGITDIQSDYSMSTGDGASVSVDVPLEFELPKKVAIATKSSDTTFTSYSLFADKEPQFGNSFGIRSKVLNLEPNSSYTCRNNNWVGTSATIYANTPAVVSIDYTDFIHDTDSNSIIKPWAEINKGSISNRVAYGRANDSCDIANTILPYSFNIDETMIQEQEGYITVNPIAFVRLDSIDPTDRAGLYTSTVTMTVSTL